EADNLAVKGAARLARATRGADGVVTAAFEHKGVLASCDRLAAEGFRIEALDRIVAGVRDRAPSAVVHTDAVQAVPWIDVARAAAGVDLVAISAHKFGGPKGTGALVVRNGTAVEPLIEGGGQEAGLRSGTSNVAGAVAMAAALRATCDARAADVVRIGALRDRLIGGLGTAVPGVFENGDRRAKVAGNAHLGFHGVEAETLLVALDQAGVCAAAGSSCSSGATDPSHVLAAMGVSRDDAR